MICDFCKRDIPERVIELHVVMCRNHSYVCEECDMVITKSAKNEHFEKYHSNEKCDACDKEVPKGTLYIHKNLHCPKRQAICEYCKISLPKMELDIHIERCSNRTVICENCQKRVFRKNYDKHLLNCLQEKECPYCDSTFDEEDIEMHIYSNHPELYI